MNSIDLLQGELAALARRVTRLEELARHRAVTTGDSTEAERIAQLIGFPVEILIIPDRISERRQFAIELRKRGWSFSRISKVMNCSERTIWRWTQ